MRSLAEVDESFLKMSTMLAKRQLASENVNREEIIAEWHCEGKQERKQSNQTSNVFSCSNDPLADVPKAKKNKLDRVLQSNRLAMVGVVMVVVMVVVSTMDQT